MQNTIREKSFSLQSLEISVTSLLLAIVKNLKSNFLWEQNKNRIPVIIIIIQVF